jgi:hypothetical protein
METLKIPNHDFERTICDAIMHNLVFNRKNKIGSGSGALK